MDFKLISRHKHIILYGICLAVLLFLLKWLELRFIILSHAFEIYAGAIAFVFTGMGIWLALKLTTPKVKTIVVEKEVYLAQTEVFQQNDSEIARLGLSGRELEVLQLIAEGLSNQQIAERLFLSLNTIKTHSSRLFEKMEVKSRTQAIEQGKRLHIIA
ncbi:response regulator transcription factor [Dyadobacter psychrotolerans]|uniref:DNA-binding response regulator n=1 Tax=Dyadobacter psychrotolerans TaxID=2541721 RepID=A0A4R5DTP0_9BACT|nr:LuxR C-terminal-related transcriptional regulator [Dyadobacter psychrotolerans]TDE15461.1 DNA-binding response regulator [Dyadobacter psychrotolerans]